MRRTREDLFQSAKTHKTLWRDIAKEMTNKGFNVSESSCQKMEGFEATIPKYC